MGCLSRLSCPWYRSKFRQTSIYDYSTYLATHTESHTHGLNRSLMIEGGKRAPVSQYGLATIQETHHTTSSDGSE